MTSESKRLDQRGSTLIDITIGLAIVGMMAAITINTLDQNIPKWRAKQAAHGFAAAIRATRAQAILDRGDTSMPVDISRARYATVVRGAPVNARRENFEGKSRNVVYLPRNVTFTSPDRTPKQVSSPIFDSRGRLDSLGSTASEAIFYIGNDTNEIYWRIVVSKPGNVKVQQYKNHNWV